MRVDLAPWGVHGSALGTLCRWADEDPLTMLRLLLDPELRDQLHRAIVDVIGPPSTSTTSTRRAAGA